MMIFLHQTRFIYAGYIKYKVQREIFVSTEGGISRGKNEKLASDLNIPQ